MRIVVLFDIPVKTKRERRIATQFRNFLLKDGYYMIQYSVYARICNGLDDLTKHKLRIINHCPENGSVRMLVMTENSMKQWMFWLAATILKRKKVLQKAYLFLKKRHSYEYSKSKFRKSRRAKALVHDCTRAFAGLDCTKPRLMRELQPRMRG